jgi:hypothetical protein
MRFYEDKEYRCNPRTTCWVCTTRKIVDGTLCQFCLDSYVRESARNDTLKAKKAPVAFAIEWTSFRARWFQHLNEDMLLLPEKSE